MRRGPQPGQRVSVRVTSVDGGELRQGACPRVSVHVIAIAGSAITTARRAGSHRGRPCRAPGCKPSPTQHAWPSPPSGASNPVSGNRPLPFWHESWPPSISNANHVGGPRYSRRPPGGRGQSVVHRPAHGAAGNTTAIRRPTAREGHGPVNGHDASNPGGSSKHRTAIAAP